MEITKRWSEKFYSPRLERYYEMRTSHGSVFIDFRQWGTSSFGRSSRVLYTGWVKDETLVGLIDGNAPVYVIADRLEELGIPHLPNTLRDPKVHP